jgi:hypothetical protein
MKKFTLILLSAAAMGLTGCLVTSVSPYYTSKDVGFEPALLGQWTNTTEAKEHWQFEKDGSNAYKLTFTSDGKTSVIQAHWFKMDGQSFLDLFSSDVWGDSQPPPIPSHFLLRVYQVSPAVKMAAVNYEWLLKLVDADPKAIRHQIIPNGQKPEDRRVVLTAETSELQRFIKKHLATADAWKDKFELQRDAAVHQGTAASK